MTQKLNSDTNCTRTVKFLYSYGGKIVPRPSDGKLRYVGGFTRVLSVDRSITFAELLVKFSESCGTSMDLKCKLPTEDLDVLVSVKSDEELRIVIEEYERASPDAKIRAVLFPLQSAKKISPPSSPMSCFDFPYASKTWPASPLAPRYDKVLPRVPSRRYLAPVVVGYPVAAAKQYCYEARRSRHLHHMPQWNHSR